MLEGREAELRLDLPTAACHFTAAARAAESDPVQGPGFARTAQAALARVKAATGSRTQNDDSLSVLASRGCQSAGG